MASRSPCVNSLLNLRMACWGLLHTYSRLFSFESSIPCCEWFYRVALIVIDSRFQLLRTKSRRKCRQKKRFRLLSTWSDPCQKMVGYWGFFFPFLCLLLPSDWRMVGVSVFWRRWPLQIPSVYEMRSKICLQVRTRTASWQIFYSNIPDNWFLSVCSHFLINMYVFVHLHW